MCQGQREPDPDPASDTDVITVAVQFVATRPGGPARVLTRHHRLADGACAGCLTSPTTWPCTAANIARKALEYLLETARC